MSLDEELAPYVNLVPSPRPGDLYMHLASKVWQELDQQTAQVSEATRSKLPGLLATIEQKQAAASNPELGAEERSLAWQAMQEWRNQTRGLRESLFPVYWSGVLDKKLRRTIMKRS